MAKGSINEIEPGVYKVIEKKKVKYKDGEKTKEKIVEEVRIVKEPIDIWLIGNTGMRNPWRIHSGFKVYAESNLVGKLRESSDQVAFKNLLFNKGEIGGDINKDKDASITRKYRLMFNKYGFAYPEVTLKDCFSQNELGGVDDITPIGKTFYNADTISAQQECFLRGLTVQMENLTEELTYSPFLWVLEVMFNLEERTGDTKLNFIEFAICVQTTNPSYDINKVVENILNIRQSRKKADNKKKYDRELIDLAWEHYLKLKVNFRDYADMNLRYIVSSGIVKRAGRGICIVPEYRTLALELSRKVTSTEPLKERYKKLCNGAPLPTDNIETANKVLQDLITELETYNIPYTIPDVTLDSAANINMVRNSLKKDIDKFKEDEYAKRQHKDWKEIYEYMNLLILNNGKEKELNEDCTIKVPKSEAAAYLEWILWRAFLAIDHISNKPYEARGFSIDQDYLPVGTAPGGGPDMIFEFEDYIIVVEVTMSTNSRQEAMEGEPVRRHVADLVLNRDKPVYGIFIANKIDSNTAETFRIGVWYTPQDKKMALKIVPLTLKQFSFFFKEIFENDKVHPDNVINLFNMCFKAKEGREAPEWKSQIDLVVHDINNSQIVSIVSKDIIYQ